VVTSVDLRLRHKIFVPPGAKVYLKDISYIVAPKEMIKPLQHMCVYEITKKDKNFVIIDGIQVVRQIKEWNPNLEVQLIGPSQTIVEVKQHRRKMSIPLFVLVWCLLFIGSSLAVMNFHEDVSMRNVHIRLYELMTGEKNEYPLILQIPYSFGLGLGMILFFNHIFRKRLNEEPSPLEVEMFNYQQDLDQYLIIHENKESVQTKDDH
jgi:stage V sporulation protein AA